MVEGIQKTKCARCHRPFTPKKEGQMYGPKCEKKIEEIEDDLRLKAADKAGELE